MQQCIKILLFRIYMKLILSFLDILEELLRASISVASTHIEVDAEPKESTRKTEEKLDGRIRKAMNERNLNEGQWEDRKQWSLGVGQRRKTF